MAKKNVKGENIAETLLAFRYLRIHYHYTAGIVTMNDSILPAATILFFPFWFVFFCLFRSLSPCSLLHFPRFSLNKFIVPNGLFTWYWLLRLSFSYYVCHFFYIYSIAFAQKSIQRTEKSGKRNQILCT